MWSRLDRITDWRVAAAQAHYCPRAFAALCGVSLRQLERYFKIRFAQSPHDWLRSIRMQEARRLLFDGLPAKAVGYELGFKQPSHFCREFKREVGVSPRAFVSCRSVPAVQTTSPPRQVMSQADNTMLGQ